MGRGTLRITKSPGRPSLWRATMSKSVLALSIITLSVLSVLSTYGQVGPTKWRDSHVPFRLLAGYKIKSFSGFEGGASGTIWKENGPNIQFGLGRLDASEADSIPAEQVLWREEQEIGEKHFTLVYTRSGELVTTADGKVPLANFHTKIRNQQDLTEVLLMFLTYEPVHGYPVDPSLIISEPQKTKNP
jgi:hypothetical protein